MIRIENLENCARNSLINLLGNHPKMGTQRKRNLILKEAGLDQFAIDINLEGTATDISGEIIDVLSNYGSLDDGDTALGRLLVTIQKYTGKENQGLIEQLVQKYKLIKTNSKGSSKILQISTINVLIITALKAELDALKTCDNDSGNSWEEHQDSLGYSYYKKTFQDSNGTDLTIAAASAVDMGETQVTQLATRLIAELKPSCLAMTGVCAGNKEDVFLGDVIVADRVFKFDHGKLIASYQEIGGKRIRTEEIAHDITTYNLKPLWKSKIQNFSQDWIKTIQTSRPKSYAHQERWLLHKLYDRQENPEAYPSPENHPKRTIECPDWLEVLDRLSQQNFLTTEPFELTEQGIREVKIERLKYPDKQRYRDLSIPQLHIGVIATTSKVQEDPEIFERLKKLERKALGVEMESAAIGAVAETHNIPMIVVKSVQDYGDYDKNDQFRFYAAETSARFLLNFLTISSL